MWRDAYCYCIDPELFLSTTTITRLLEAIASFDTLAPSTALSTTLDAARAWSSEQTTAYRALVATTTDGALSSDEVAHTVLRQSSPLASTLGAWLQGMSAPSVFEDETHLQVLALFADDVGVGRPQSSRFDGFKTTAKQHGRPELAVDAVELAAERRIRDHMFALPAALFAITRRSDEFAALIVGVDLVVRTIGTMPCWSAFRTEHGVQSGWASMDLAQQSGAADAVAPLATSQRIVEQFCATGADVRRQVERGAAWMLSALRSWDLMLRDEVESAADPHLAMSRLVQERAREGAIYHQNFRMGDTSLSALLDRAKADPAPLLQELAVSRVIKPGAAERSALVNGLIGPRGPMFRVFSPEDVTIISRWIDSLADSGSKPAPAAPAVRAPQPLNLAALEAGSSEDGIAPGDIREAYHVLQGRALAPATRRFAIRYVGRWLARAKLSVGRTNRSLPDRWTPAGLRPWVLDKHDSHDAEFESSRSSEPPTRDEVIDSTLQLATLTLIDGSWLQGFTDVGLATTRYGSPLFETYWDELGNGRIEINHPKIYRDVLREMDIELPPTGSREFAYDSRFRDESFERPVYWLCLGKLPRMFLPEILGMNLAMELSGVGGSYRTARTFLRHYGFSTHFVDLHNTIDNVSTGHSAWAADAIDVHMRSVVSLSGSAAIAAEWSRVRTGYESLSPLPSKVADLIGYRFLKFPGKSRSRYGPLFHHTPLGAS